MGLLCGHSLNNFPCSECGDLDGCHLPAKLMDDRLSLSEFWEMQAQWSRATFGADNERGPKGPLLHLQKEVAEVLAKPDDLEEYVDCLFLVFDATRRAGFSFEDLRRMANQKLKKNMARRWQRPTSDAPVEHDRSGE